MAVSVVWTTAALRMWGWICSPTEPLVKLYRQAVPANCIGLWVLCAFIHHRKYELKAVLYQLLLPVRVSFFLRSIAMKYCTVLSEYNQTLHVQNRVKVQHDICKTNYHFNSENCCVFLAHQILHHLHIPCFANFQGLWSVKEYFSLSYISKRLLHNRTCNCKQHYIKKDDQLCTAAQTQRCHVQLAWNWGHASILYSLKF